jgi:diaminohydroxyphosphoribosylaminopyrimidine deaminase/5-amino-6-(5-phosphoribosylamino)uracil reductase
VALLASLAREGLTRIFCEGGGAFAASLLKAGLVDELAVFTAGLALGAEGRPGLGALAFDGLADAPRFRLVSVEPVGGDILHIWRAPTSATVSVP